MAQHIAIIQSPNMSLGVNLLFKLAASGGEDWAMITTSKSSKAITASRKTPPAAPPRELPRRF